MSSASSRAQRAIAAGEGFGGLLLSDPFDLNYITGFSGSNGLAVLTESEQMFFTDFRYREQAATEVHNFTVEIVGQDLFGGAGRAVRSIGVSKLGFNQNDLSVKQFGELKEAVGEVVELVEAGAVVANLRKVKDAGELKAIREAAQLADSCWQSVVSRGIIGKTEKEIAFALETQMRSEGAASVSFPPIVAAAEHGALPHAQPRDVEIPKDTLVVIDWGCMLDGYCSDCTRTVATGEITDEMGEVYQLVLDAQQQALAAVAAGVSCRQVDNAARQPISAMGFGECFGHGTGHGVGLEVHEPPRVSGRSDETLASGNVVTVEPGIYLPSKFGVRIEDLVYVSGKGPEILTSISKSLTVVA